MTTLYPYQEKGVRWLRHCNGRGLLADEQGVGKTIQVARYVYEDTTGNVLVVCGATIKYNWQSEFHVHVGMRSTVLESFTPPPFYPDPSEGRVFIINYTILPKWIEWLWGLELEAFVMDECQAIKNAKSKQSRACRAVCRGGPHKVPRVIGTSGTPIENRHSEFFPALNLIRPDKFPSFLSYAMEYCDSVKKPWGWDHRGSRNGEQLHALLTKTCMLRRLQKDVLPELPGFRREVSLVDITDRKQYVKAEKDFINWLEEVGGWERASRAQKVETLVKRGYLLRLVAQLKLPAVIQWVENFLEETDGKLILFGIHKALVQPIHAHFAKLSVIIDGSVTARERQNRIDRFNLNPTCRLCVANIVAAGTGWNGTAAHTVAFAELDWVPAKHSQAEKRINRIGQTALARFIYLVARQTVEVAMCDTLQSKQNVLDVALDGAEREDGINVHSLYKDVFSEVVDKLLETKGGG